MALIAWYKLDGNANDSSGNNRNATASNLTYTTGKIFQCGSFNGIDNYISFSSLPSEYGKKSTTLSAWIKAPGIAPGMSVSGIVGINYGCTLSISSDGKLRGYSDNGASSIATYGTSNLYDDTWHHVVYTNDGFVTKLYVDSILQAQNSVVYNNRYSNPFIIGSEPNNPPVSRFNGLIDDVRIYDHALSSKEVKLLSQAKVLHYDFDDFQEPTTNLYNGSNASLGSGSTLTNLGTGWSALFLGTSGYGYRFYTDLANLVNASTYTGSVEVYNPDATPTSVALDWCDVTSTSYSLAPQETRIISTTAARATYDSTFRFLDITGSVNKTIHIRNIQVEKKDYYTPYVNGTRTGLVKDISGYENNATLSTATTPQWINSSILGAGAYRFNGSSSFIKSTSSFSNIKSVSMWVKGAIPVDSRILFVHNNTGTGLGFYNNGFLIASSSTNSKRTAIISNYNLNNWNHLVVVYSEDNTPSVYINGAETSYSTTNYWTTSENALYLGARESGSYFNGDIDDVRIYATALQAADILELYQTKANLDNAGNLFTHMLSSTWPKNAREYKQLNPSATSGVYNIRPTGSSNYIEAYCDMSTLTHSGETGWTLVGSWAEASEWGKTSLSSAEPFLTTVKNCISSNFGNEVIHAFRILVSNDITQTGSAAVADWYYYWAEGTTWKAVWAPDGRNFEYWFSPASSGVPRTILRPFDLSYNLKFGYARTTHKYNNLSDYGYTNTTMRSDIKGLIGGSNAGVNGYCNYWRALTQPGYKFGAYNLSYSGSFESGTSPCADGTLAIPTSASASVCMGQDVDSGVSAKIGYDDGGAWKAASTAASTAVTISDVAANGVKMWWFIL